MPLLGKTRKKHSGDLPSAVYETCPLYPRLLMLLWPPNLKYIAVVDLPLQYLMITQTIWRPTAVSVHQSVS